MRVIAALLAVSLLVGCGSSEQAGLSTDAAELVPPDAVAFVSFDTDLNSEEWRRVMDVWGPLALSIGNLDFERDVRPAVGDQLDYAILNLDEGPVPESSVWLMQPKDESKLRRLVNEALGPGLSIQKIGGWSVVTDSAAAFTRVRASHAGRSLADVEWFNNAKEGLSGDAVAAGYGHGEGVQELSHEVTALARIMGSPRWIAAGIGAQDDAVRVEVTSAAPVAVYRPRLIDEVPSGALLALSFKDAHELPARIGAEPSLDEYRTLLVDLAPALRGEGILYLAQGALLPTIVLEVESPRPDDAVGALRRLARTLRAETNGLLAFKVVARGNRVLLTNGSGWPATPARRLVDDQTFKDAFAAADAPEEVSWLAYADVQRLAPIVQALSQLLTGKPLGKEQKARLDRLGTLIAFGARSGPISRLVARITTR